MTSTQNWAGRSSLPYGTITSLLRAKSQRHDEVLANAVAAVYEDLRRIAGRQLSTEQRTPTFDTESLIHEVYLRLARQDRTEWQNRHHFFAIAARIMRRVLVDRARRRGFAKRGGDARITTLESKEIADTSQGIHVLALEDALQDLHRHDPTLAQLVELRFFAGASNLEIAAAQQVTTMTVVRRWRLAKAWLQRYLTGRPQG